MFVFDDRMTVDFSDHTEVIGRCSECGAPTANIENYPDRLGRELRVVCPGACPARFPRVVSSRRDRRAIPVVIVAGFLGAGKTTLLNALLGNTAGGAPGSGRQRLRGHQRRRAAGLGQSAGTISFGNGCLCCTVDADGLAEALSGLAAAPAGWTP